jgi:hypothetical protein
MNDLWDDDEDLDFGEPGGDSGGEPESAVGAHNRLAIHQRKVRALVEDETGVRFESLVLFAEPLLQLYELEAEEAFRLRDRPDEADESVIAVIEAARLLWAYFSLDPSERLARRPVLAAHLVGPEPSEEDEADLDALIESTAPHWRALSKEEVRFAEDVEAPTLDFDALASHPAFDISFGEREDGTYGPQGLGELEARALFAQPLLEDERALADPDVFDAIMERASDYWHLAQLPEHEQQAYLNALARAHAGTPEDVDRVREEAGRMVARFYTLFPERAAT